MLTNFTKTQKGEYRRGVAACGRKDMHQPRVSCVPTCDFHNPMFIVALSTNAPNSITCNTADTLSGVASMKNHV